MHFNNCHSYVLSHWEWERWEICLYWEQLTPPAASSLPQQVIWCRGHQHSQPTSEATICALLFISNSEGWDYRDTGPVSGFPQVDDLAFTLWINFSQWEKFILNIFVMKFPVVRFCKKKPTCFFVVLSLHDLMSLDALHNLFLNSRHFYASINFYYM